MAYYKKTFGNLNLTDYVWFQFFQAGELLYEVRLAEVAVGMLTLLPEHFVKFVDLF